jgi:hypothetical protein
VPRGALVAVLVIVSGLVLVGVLIWPVTDLLAAHDVGRIAGPQRAVHLQTAREAVRSQMLTLTAGIFVAGTLWFTAQSYRLARRGQVTDRSTRAIEQLGSDKLAVRIGSIYALEHIARDSPPDHSMVIEVLAAFAREQSQVPWPAPDDPGRRTRPDVEAAVTVIGRRITRNDRLPIDISHAQLIWIYLPQAHLEGLDFYATQMPRAILRGAHLERARLGHVNFSDADLSRADLTGATVTDADLTGAKLDGAILTGADLTGARFSPDAVLPAGWARDPGTGLLSPALHP